MKSTQNQNDPGTDYTPTEAEVEAAARALFEDENRDPEFAWEGHPERWRKGWRRSARAALVAAHAIATPADTVPAVVLRPFLDRVALYGHPNMCDSYDGSPCDCGLDDARALLPEGDA